LAITLRGVVKILAGSNVCKTSGLKKKDCWCFNCITKRNNAIHRAGNPKPAGGQDSRKVHDSKGKNNHGRKSW
jgi:hypothetical protein